MAGTYSAPANNFFGVSCHDNTFAFLNGSSSQPLHISLIFFTSHSAGSYSILASPVSGIVFLKNAAGSSSTILCPSSSEYKIGKPKN